MTRPATSQPRRRYLLPLLGCLVLVACAHALNSTNMAATNLPARAAATSLGPTAIVVVRTNTSPDFNAAFKAAIEKSVADARMFSLGRASEEDYRIGAMTELKLPFSVAAMTVILEVEWSLTRTKDSAVPFRKTIKVTYTGSAFDSFDPEKRRKIAIEAATRQNIEEFLGALAVAEY